MPKRSAGLLMYRQVKQGLQVFLVHPGGPFWSARDKGAWAIPKGEYHHDEDPFHAAQREFQEETGFTPSAPFLPLGAVRQSGGKIVTAWAFAGDCDPARLVSNTCEIEWPPHSGKTLEIPEIDQGRWFTLSAARDYMRPDQQPFLAALQQHLEASLPRD